jgi:hypothetical protein
MAEADLYTFAILVNPTYMYGVIHKEVCKWLQDDSDDLNKLLLLPRGHLKSHLMATYAAWRITKMPEIIILYGSATNTLTELQLEAIKNILISESYTDLWPDMVHPNVHKRKKWTNSAISVDHPARAREAVRDPTVATISVNATSAGQHCDLLIYDDMVVPENAYTAVGRRDVSQACSFMASVLSPGGQTVACGTRYHPKDQYNTWINALEEEFNDEGDVVGTHNRWKTFERVVEVNGRFLWPRTKSPTSGKWYGFNRKTLAAKKAEYDDKTHFHSQYYNDPNDPSTDNMNYSMFQYYEPEFIVREDGRWIHKATNSPLNLYAAIDFAFSLSTKADYSAIAVIAVDVRNHVYVLDLHRFKTNRIKNYFEAIKKLHEKWKFRHLRAECTAAQSVIVQELKDDIVMEGLMLSVEEYRPHRSQGSKEERIEAALKHRYENGSIWHKRDGLFPMLEEELVQAHPAHDDLKDVLAAAVESAVRPADLQRSDHYTRSRVVNSRWGGVVGIKRNR